DLTVFRHHQVSGLNFAFIGGVANYHTPDDNLANASPASLQHQGENALAAVTGLAAVPDLDRPHSGNLAYFDVLSRFVLRWPLGWSLGMALLALVLLLVLAVLALRGGGVAGSALGLGLLVVPVVLVVAALLGMGLQFVLTAAGPLAAPALAHPL